MVYTIALFAILGLFFKKINTIENQNNIWHDSVHRYSLNQVPNIFKYPLIHP